MPYRSGVVDREIAIVGAPLDLGAGGRRGVDMGPSAIRYAGLGERVDELGIASRDLGNVTAGQVSDGITVQRCESGPIPATLTRDTSRRSLVPAKRSPDGSARLRGRVSCRSF